MYIWFKSEIKNSFFLDSHHFKAIRIILLSNIKAINKDILKPYDNSLTNLLLLGESRFNNIETYTIVKQFNKFNTADSKLFVCSLI